MENISIAELNEVTYKALLGKGHTQEDAALIRDILMWAQIRGNNQSVIKIPSNGVDVIPNAGSLEIEHETPISARIHAHSKPGIVAMSYTCDTAIQKVKNSGIAIVGMHGISNGSGPIGYYARKIAAEGYIALVMSQTFELMAPFNGTKPLFGTNPIAYGIPRGNNNPPLVFDAAMSGISFFGVHEAKANGKQLPENVALDKDGQPTTDPSAALEGALRTFDCGAKGSHLALLVELIGGAWTGGDVLDKKGNKNWGNLIIAINPEVMGKTSEFLERVELFCERYKSQESMDGKGIMLPGERGESARERTEAAGTISLPDHVIAKLRELGKNQ